MARNAAQSGFTLVTIVFLMVAVGLFIVATLSALSETVSEDHRKATAERLAVIKDAIHFYAQDRDPSILPCPARLDVDFDDPAFGVERCGPPFEPAPAQFRSGGRVIGAVPTKTLNLPKEAALDAWGNRILYAVVESEMALLTNVTGAGSIRVFGESGTLTEDGVIVLVSMGPDEAGAFNINGVRGRPCPAPPPNNLAENCDMDRNFMQKEFFDDETSADYFDDILIFQDRVPD